jgi:hypothetical protein
MLPNYVTRDLVAGWSAQIEQALCGLVRQLSHARKNLNTASAATEAAVTNAINSM